MGFARRHLGAICVARTLRGLLLLAVEEMVRIELNLAYSSHVNILRKKQGDGHEQGIVLSPFGGKGEPLRE